MKSYEVLRNAADKIGVKALAAELKLSPAMVYKWCQEFDEDDPDASGARNPLDRLAEIVSVTGDKNVVNWLCHQAGGFFVPNPPTRPTHIGQELVVETQQLMEDFSELLRTVTKSIVDDGEIEPHEAERIRDEWERFKSAVEEFTMACEQGAYRKSK